MKMPKPTFNRAPKPKTAMPKPKTAAADPTEPEQPMISPDLDTFDLEAAVWIHGDYPQLPWPNAVRKLYAKCRETPFGNISAGAIAVLDRDLPKEASLENDLAWTQQERIGKLRALIDARRRSA